MGVCVMRVVNVAAVAVFLMLAAGPALAGDPRGGHPGGGGGCGGGCGGGHRPSPPHGGGYNGNINVNVSANANASAYAGASAGSYLNARTYNVGSIRGGGYGGGTVYVGGGYGGEGGGYYGGGAIYNEEVYEGRTCASAPFGYVVYGFGRNGRRAPACVADVSACRDGDDRGGRYGYSERRGCDGGRREDRYGRYEESRSYEQSSSYESREYYEESAAYSGGYGYETRNGGDDHGRDDRVDCDCRPERERFEHRSERSHGYAEPYAPPAYAPPVYEAPAYEPPAYQAPAYEAPVYEAPMTPNQYYGIGDQSPPPRQYYSQEPGERG